MIFCVVLDVEIFLLKDCFVYLLNFVRGRRHSGAERVLSLVSFSTCTMPGSWKVRHVNSGEWKVRKPCASGKETERRDRNKGNMAGLRKRKADLLAANTATRVRNGRKEPVLHAVIALIQSVRLYAQESGSVRGCVVRAWSAWKPLGGRVRRHRTSLIADHALSCRCQIRRR